MSHTRRISGEPLARPKRDNAKRLFLGLWLLGMFGTEIAMATPRIEWVTAPDSSGTYLSEISDDGNRAVGYSITASGRKPLRWAKDSGVEMLVLPSPALTVRTSADRMVMVDPTGAKTLVTVENGAAGAVWMWTGVSTSSQVWPFGAFGCSYLGFQGIGLSSNGGRILGAFTSNGGGDFCFNAENFGAIFQGSDLLSLHQLVVSFSGSTVSMAGISGDGRYVLLNSSFGVWRNDTQTSSSSSVAFNGYAVAYDFCTDGKACIGQSTIYSGQPQHPFIWRADVEVTGIVPASLTDVVYRSGTLSAWSPLTGAVLTIENGIVNFTDNAPLTGTGFYRVGRQ